MLLKLKISHYKIWQKDISQIPSQEMKKILQRIQELATYPWQENVQVKRLQSYKITDFRLRVGNYRILFNFDLENRQVSLLRVLHRSKLY